MLPYWYVIIVLQFWPMDAPSYLWNYENTELWQDTFPLCDAPLQSPISLTQDRVVFSLPPKVVAGDGLAQGEVTATNTGRLLELQLRPANRTQPALQLISYKKPLFGVYDLDSVQMHWGDGGGTQGSEHAINDKFSDGEVQFVFFNKFYGSMSKAQRHAGGVAIISVLLRGATKLAEPSFPTLGLEERLEALAAPGNEVTYAADLSPVHALLTDTLDKVLAYYGSLTIPPCNPVVTWMVSAEEKDVSAHFLHGLATRLFEDKGMQLPLVNNWRPLQDRSGRLITKLQTIAV